MKSLLAGLIIVLATTGCRAASTSTISVAVEKTVEIHMTHNVASALQESKKVRRVQTLPLAGHGTCSGEFINNNGDILTARHCVDGFDEFEVQTADRRIYTAVVIATSAAHDLALIHIDRRNTPFFRLAETVERGQVVFVLGSPLGITDTLSTGIVARLAGDVTLLDCSVLPGNSGGPVMDVDGNLIGVVNAGFIVMAGVTHLNIIQGLDAVHFFIQEATEKRYGR